MPGLRTTLPPLDLMSCPGLTRQIDGRNRPNESNAANVTCSLVEFLGAQRKMHRTLCGVIGPRLDPMRFWLTQFFSNREYHKRAFEEVFIVLTFSIFPLLLLPFVGIAKLGVDSTFEWGATLWAAVASGQLYLYSFSLFGTLMWLCVEDVSNKVFPPRKYFAAASVLAAFLCLAIYGLDPGLTKPLHPTLIYISIVIYVVYVATYYSLLVFKMLRAPDLGETLDQEANQLISQSRRRRGKQA
jgi:hypothetical protein